jgi:ribose transport system permease protein
MIDQTPESAPDASAEGQAKAGNGSEPRRERNPLSHLRVIIRQLLGLRESGIFIALVLIFSITALISPEFRTGFNLTILAEQTATIAIMGTGQTLVIISGAFDISQAAVAGLAAMVSALIWQDLGLNPILALLAGILCGVLAGITNGILASVFRLHPIVMTLATSTIFMGVTYLLTGGQPVIGLPSQLLWLGGGTIGPVPVSVIVMIIVVAFMQILLTRVRFGVRVRQVGGNVEAARLIGINVRRVWLGVFVISAVLAALGGEIEMGRIGNAIPTIGSTLLFPIITASILGGTLLTGGEGSMIGTMLGAVVLTVINNALVILQVNPFSQQVVQGALVVAALIVDQFRRGNLTLRGLLRPEV